jgi:hypothetical protein
LSDLVCEGKVRAIGASSWASLSAFFRAAPTCQNSFFRSFDLVDETGSPGESVDIGDSSNTETDARL